MDDEIKELKRQYKVLDDELKKEVDNLKKLLDTVPIDYIDITGIATDIKILKNQRDDYKSKLIANQAF